MAFDRLSETEVGFYGSILLPKKLGQTETNWGDDNWTLYPLAQMLSRDKTLFYQHDLALETFSDNKANITWNLAMGYNLGDDLRLTEGNIHDHPWLKLNGELQDHLLADYASERITNFAYLTSSVTRTDFQKFFVIANWDNQNTYTFNGNTIGWLGAMIQNLDGSETAGILSGFNGQPLSAGDHYLIIKSSPIEIIIRQPMGSDTSLTVPLPAGWNAQDPIQATALNQAGNVINTIPYGLSDQGITFTLKSSLSGQEVEAVRIIDPNITIHNLYLPVLAR